MRYDTIVLGTGPAGLSAAITLKLRNKSVLVIGNTDVSEKVYKAQEINNYLGIPGIKGDQLAKIFLGHAKSLDIEMVNNHVYAVYAMGRHFSVQSAENEAYEAKTVVVATGVSFGKAYPGELEFLGRGVSYCATCDAPLYRDKRVVIIGASANEEAEADFMSEICSEVIYIPLYKDTVNVSKKVNVVYDTPVEITGQLKADRLILKNRELQADGFFILRESVPPAQLIPGLRMNGNHIGVDSGMRTNIAGCFACGDVVGTPYQYIKAAGEGNVAAISVIEYLSKLKQEDKNG